MDTVNTEMPFERLNTEFQGRAVGWFQRTTFRGKDATQISFVGSQQLVLFMDGKVYMLTPQEAQQNK